MAGKGNRKGSQSPIVIKKNEIVEGGHHGGAWKVAYADFVTAMMAFFLLMWLLNATTEDQRKGLADYFSPNNLISHASSGTGQPFGGHTPFDEGAMVSDRGQVQVTQGKRPVLEQTEDGPDPVHTEYHHARTGDGIGIGPSTDDQGADDDQDFRSKGEKGDRAPPGPGGPADAKGKHPTDPTSSTVTGTPASNRMAQAEDGLARGGSAQTEADQTGAALTAADKAAQETGAFQTAADQIRRAVQADPALASIANQLAVDMTPDGLRIQILDEVKLPMFATGSSDPNERVRLLVQKLVPVLNKLKEPISISGYTDAAPFPGRDRTNWELSTERANAARRLLVEDGLTESRIQSVTGHADRDPLLPAEPMAAANRRIAILVLRQAPVPAAPAKP